MPIFYTQPPDKRKRKLANFWGYLMIGFGVFLFGGLFFFDLNQIHKLFYIVFGLNMLFSGLDKIKGKQKRFIYIDDEKIDCIEDVNGTVVATVAWTDIRWLKKENSGGITIYRESSFSNHLSFADFSEEDTKKICRLITEQAIIHNTRLINFSEPISAVA